MDSLLEIDVARKRIALSMKKQAEVESKSGKAVTSTAKRQNKPKPVNKPVSQQGSMANAFAQALKK